MVNKINKFKKQNNMKSLRLCWFLPYNNPSSEFSITREHTLIPRTTMTNIWVYHIHVVDIIMNESHQSQGPQIFSIDDGPNSDTTNNNMVDIIAKCNGNVNCVRDMVSKKKELLWCEDSQGNLPLHLALEKGHIEVANYLIEEFPQGSYALNHFQKSPLYLGVENGHKDLVDFMLKNLARDKEATKILRESIPSILFPAITSNSQEMVQVILKYQPELINTRNEKGWSPLTCAANDGLTYIIDFLLETFPDLVHKDYSYPIHKACIRGHVDILKMFHSHCPKYFTNPDQNGQNILHHAAKEPKNKLKAVVSYLLTLEEARKLMEKKDENGRTPFRLAQKNRNGEVVEIFQQNMSP